MRRVDVLIAGFSIASIAAALSLSRRLRVAMFELHNEHPLRGMMSMIGVTPLNGKPIAGHEFDVIANSALASLDVLVDQHGGDFLGFDPESGVYSYRSSLAADQIITAPRLIAGSCGCTPELPLSLGGASDLWGAGLSTCAWSDGPSYRGRHVLVMGSGHWALDQVRMLRLYTDRVTVLEDSSQPDRFPPLPRAEFEALGTRHLRVPGVTAIERAEGASDLVVRGLDGVVLTCGAVFYAPDLVPAWPLYLAGLHVDIGGAMSPVGVEAGLPYFDHSGLYEQGASVTAD